MRKHDMIHKNEEDQKCLFLQKEYFCLRYNREGKQRMYEEFLKQIEDFIKECPSYISNHVTIKDITTEVIVPIDTFLREG